MDILNVFGLQVTIHELILLLSVVMLAFEFLSVMRLKYINSTAKFLLCLLITGALIDIWVVLILIFPDAFPSVMPVINLIFKGGG